MPNLIVDQLLNAEQRHHRELRARSSIAWASARSGDDEICACPNREIDCSSGPMASFGRLAASSTEPSVARLRARAAFEGKAFKPSADDWAKAMASWCRPCRLRSTANRPSCPDLWGAEKFSAARLVNSRSDSTNRPTRASDKARSDLERRVSGAVRPLDSVNNRTASSKCANA